MFSKGDLFNFYIYIKKNETAALRKVWHNIISEIWHAIQKGWADLLKRKFFSTLWHVI